MAGWTGFRVHLDDEFWPEEGSDAKNGSGTIEIRIESAAVEVLASADLEAPDKRKR